MRALIHLALAIVYRLVDTFLPRSLIASSVQDRDDNKSVLANDKADHVRELFQSNLANVAINDGNPKWVRLNSAKHCRQLIAKLKFQSWTLGLVPILRSRDVCFCTRLDSKTQDHSSPKSSARTWSHDSPSFGLASSAANRSSMISLCRSLIGGGPSSLMLSQILPINCKRSTTGRFRISDGSSIWLTIFSLDSEGSSLPCN